MQACLEDYVEEEALREAFVNLLVHGALARSSTAASTSSWASLTTTWVVVLSTDWPMTSMRRALQLNSVDLPGVSQGRRAGPERLGA